MTTVMFDVGGVLILTPFEMAARLEQVRGLKPGALGLAGPFAPDRDPAWRGVMAGHLSEDDYWLRQAERLGPILGVGAGDPTSSLMEVLFGGEAGDCARPELGPALDRLQAGGIRTAVLSNHLGRFHRPDLIEALFGRFDPVIDLSFADVRKPDPRAFASAVEKLGEGDPAAVVHVDDQPVHIAGAERAGLRGVLFDPVDVDRSVARVLAAAGGCV